MYVGEEVLCVGAAETDGMTVGMRVGLREGARMLGLTEGVAVVNEMEETDAFAIECRERKL